MKNRNTIIEFQFIAIRNDLVELIDDLERKNSIDLKYSYRITDTPKQFTMNAHSFKSKRPKYEQINRDEKLDFLAFN